MQPSALETAILNWFVMSIAEPALTAQVAGASVSSRETTDVGFFTTLSLPEEVTPISSLRNEPMCSFGECGLFASELSAGAECRIHLTHGLLSSIEVWSFADGHPLNIGQFEFRRLQVNHMTDVSS